METKDVFLMTEAKNIPALAILPGFICAYMYDSPAIEMEWGMVKYIVYDKEIRLRFLIIPC